MANHFQVVFVHGFFVSPIRLFLAGRICNPDKYHEYFMVNQKVLAHVCLIKKQITQTRSHGAYSYIATQKKVHTYKQSPLFDLFKVFDYIEISHKSECFAPKRPFSSKRARHFLSYHLITPSPTLFRHLLKKSSDDQFLKRINYSQLFVADAPMDLFFSKN